MKRDSFDQTMENENDESGDDDNNNVDEQANPQYKEANLIAHNPNPAEQIKMGKIIPLPSNYRSRNSQRSYNKKYDDRSQTHQHNHYNRNNSCLRIGRSIDFDKLPDNINISLLQCLLEFLKSCQTRKITLELCIMDNELLIVQHKPILAKVTVIEQIHLMQICSKLSNNKSGKHQFKGHHEVKKQFRKFKQLSYSKTIIQGEQNFNQQLVKNLYTSLFNFFYYYLKNSVTEKKLQRFDQLIKLVASDISNDKYTFPPFHFGIFKELCQKYLRKILQLFLINGHFIEAKIKKKLNLNANQSSLSYLKTYLTNQYNKLQQFQFNFQHEQLEQFKAIGPIFIFNKETKKWQKYYKQRSFYKPNYKVHNTILRQVQHPIHLQVHEHLIQYFQNISKLSSDQIFNFSLQSECKYLQASVKYYFRNLNIQDFVVPKDSIPRVQKVLFEGTITYDKRKGFSFKQIAGNFKENFFYSQKQSLDSNRYFKNSYWVQLQYESQRLVFTNSQKVFITAKTEQRIKQIKKDIEDFMKHINCKVNQLSRELVYSVYLNYDYSKITSVEFLFVQQFPEKGHKVCFFKEKKFEKNKFEKQSKQKKEDTQNKQQKKKKEKKKEQLPNNKSEKVNRIKPNQNISDSLQKEDEKQFGKKKRIQAYLYPSGQIIITCGQKQDSLKKINIFLEYFKSKLEQMKNNKEEIAKFDNSQHSLIKYHNLQKVSMVISNLYSKSGNLDSWFLNGYKNDKPSDLSQSISPCNACNYLIQKQSLKILSWNLWRNWRKLTEKFVKYQADEENISMTQRITAIIKLIEQHNPDFVCLQQANGYNKQLYETFSSRYYFPQIDLKNQKIQTIILSRYPVCFYKIYQHQSQLASQSVFCQFQLKRQNGDIQKVLVHSIHLRSSANQTEKGWSIRVRAKQLRFYDHIYSNYDIVISAGDFNLPGHDSEDNRQILSGGYIDLQNQLLPYPFNQQPTMLRKSFIEQAMEQGKSQRFDRIMVRYGKKKREGKQQLKEQIKLINFHIIGKISLKSNQPISLIHYDGKVRSPSDHFGLVAQIGFVDNDKLPEPKLQRKATSKKEETFSEFKQQMKQMKSPETIQESVPQRKQEMMEQKKETNNKKKPKKKEQMTRQQLREEQKLDIQFSGSQQLKMNTNSTNNQKNSLTIKQQVSIKNETIQDPVQNSQIQKNNQNQHQDNSNVEKTEKKAKGPQKKNKKRR